MDDSVNKLVAFLTTFNGKLLALPKQSLAPQKEYAVLGIRHIKITQAKPYIDIMVPVSDEWQEIDTAPQAVLLHMILQTCEYYEEASDYEEWRIDSEFPDTVFIKQLYDEITTVTKMVRQIIGKNLAAISDFDMQLNTGLAKKLRNLKD